jgi:glycosyltransferase involved in cell wall biosynthesis
MSEVDVTVLMPVYQGDDRNSLKSAVDSVLHQSVEPRELLIVIEPPLKPAVSDYINHLTSDICEIRTESVSEGTGLGKALNIGVSSATSRYIARMDSDDISKQSRLELQMQYMKTNEHLDVVGSYSGEFSHSPESLDRIKAVPTTQDEITSYAQFRNPINHPTVLFRREAVIDSGKYNDVPDFEDYDLWVRMIQDGANFENIPEVLVYSRADDDFSTRRGGINYFKNELHFQLRLYKYGFISLTTVIRNSLFRGGVRLLPPRLRDQVYAVIRGKT